MNSWWLAALFLCSFVLTGLCRLYALRIRMLDIPNARSSHAVPTPRGGGIGLVLTFLIGSSLFVRHSVVPDTIIVGVMLAGALVATVGFVDDHHHLPAVLRLAVHALASLILLYVVKMIPVVPWFSTQLSLGWFGYVMAGISLVWLLNLYNFMDGIDGIAGVEAVSVVGGAILILWMNSSHGFYGLWLAALGVAVAGFLVWNLPPAKIFMGDVGSGFVGFVLGCFAVLTSGQQGINIWTWLILLAVFIVDATVTLIRRLLRRDRFWQAHRSHAYQILSRRYNSHARVTIGVLLINVFWLLPWAIVSARMPFYALFCVLVAVLPLVVLAVKVGAGTIND